MKRALVATFAWSCLQATAAGAAAQAPGGDASSGQTPASTPNATQRAPEHRARASAASAPAHDSLQERRRLLELRLLEREYRQYRLTGPVALMIIGGGIASLGLVAGALATACDSDSDVDCEYGDQTGFIAMTIAGAAVAGTGLVWLLTLVSERADLKTRIERMRREATARRPLATMDFMPTLCGARLRISF